MNSAKCYTKWLKQTELSVHSNTELANRKNDLIVWQALVLLAGYIANFVIKNKPSFHNVMETRRLHIEQAPHLHKHS